MASDLGIMFNGKFVSPLKTCGSRIVGEALYRYVVFAIT
jgi:hypothetical protein